jgi:hypothetical protein
VEVERDLQRLGPRQDRPEEPVVQVATAGVAVDQGSLEAVHADRTLQLVVGLAGERYRLDRVELPHPWGGQGQDLDVDDGGVHVRDPALADVAQLLDEPGEARRHLRVRSGGLGLFPDLAPWTVHERRGRVVLFKRDRMHLILS